MRVIPGLIMMALMLLPMFPQQSDAQPSPGLVVVPSDALLTTPVSGLDATSSSTSIVNVSGQRFSRALYIRVGKGAKETNATQLTMLNVTPVKQGDTLIAVLNLRNIGPKDERGLITVGFEKKTSPWTKSVWRTLSTPALSGKWKRYVIPFLAAESYAPGEAMFSIRFALRAQELDIGGFSLHELGAEKTREEIQVMEAGLNPIGKTRVHMDRFAKLQRLEGFGGNFCQGRYGSSDVIDPSGELALKELHVAHARVGFPLDQWTPQQGLYQDTGPAHGVLQLMSRLTRLKIPITLSIWEAPAWMVDDPKKEYAKIIPRALYPKVAEAITRFLVQARDSYGANVTTISFNEADYGVAIKLTPEDVLAMAKECSTHFAQAGLKVQWLVGDTTGGRTLPDYARALLKDKEAAAYLGPIAFHCWDALEASDEDYKAIAKLGRECGRPIWCLEAGHDSAYWQVKPEPWASWENALNLAAAYAKTLRLTRAVHMDYWTYQNNYPLTSADITDLYPVYHILKRFVETFPAGTQIVETRSESDDLQVLGGIGQSKSVQLVIANRVGAGRVSLQGLPVSAPLKVYRYDAIHSRQPVETKITVGTAGKVTVDVPARSVLFIQGAH